MKAARLHQYGQPLHINDIEIPIPKGEEVLVKVGGAGVCHSDVPLTPRLVFTTDNRSRI
ncbi:MAG: hypothetical protein HZA82_06690 [Thaumarchaeota archaeon]|nr:hypothetical protein [Nitrososphaerota archaeon]